MKLAEKKIFNGYLFGLVKFMKPEFVDRFREGNIRMSDLNTYIKMEKKSMIRGMGDKLEGAAVIKAESFELYEEGTDNLFFTGNSSRFTLTSNDLTKTPVFCSFAINDKILEIINEDNDYYYVKPQLDEKDVEKLIQDFDNTAVLIDVKFIQRFIDVCKKKNIGVKADIIKYFDYGINQKDRLKQYTDIHNPNMCFIKDKYFESQNEHRIALKSERTTEPITFNIGDISDITTVFDIKDFFSKYGMKLKKQE
ncbi:hypothetical protein [Rummeliibacillus pycnus]|uniref:hypothetical protein n=1 Tax=Rummeliibacillus pycnus TaxID=101070 RepID=UPI000C9CA675|nr:hypothetical protein [Rummeliibacillus pycnus]